MYTNAAEIFDSAVEAYARYRPRYPDPLVDWLVAEIGLGPADRVVDIGCGSGQLTLPLSARVGEVVAVDPNAEMLAAGARAAAVGGYSGITWVRAEAAELRTLDLGSSVKAATFAASFHWTERAAVLADLAAVLDTDGAVVVIGDDLRDEDEPDWAQAIAAIRERYLGADSRVPSPGRRDAHAGASHAEVLRASAFSDVQARMWPWSRELTLDEVVGLQFSYSFSTPALFEGRDGDFAAEVRTALSRLRPAGTFVEPFRASISVARRP